MYCTSHNTEYTAQQLQLWYTSNISNACDCYCWPRTEGRRSRGLPFPPVLWWPNTAKCKIIKACARYTGQACLSHTHTYKVSPAAFLRCMYTQTGLMHTRQSIGATGWSMMLDHSEPTVVRTADEPKQVAEEECSHHLHDVLKWNTTPREALTLTQAQRRCC